MDSDFRGAEIPFTTTIDSGDGEIGKRQKPPTSDRCVGEMEMMVTEGGDSNSWAVAGFPGADTQISIERVLLKTRAEGPGLRAAIWVRGCSIRCRGCVNPQLFDFTPPNRSVSDVVSEVVSAGVEGITLLGGEPFDQVESCGILAKRLKKLGFGVITFSGYTNNQLIATGLDQSSLYLSTDLLVDGQFESANLESERALVGSANQNFVHLTDRYRSFDEYHMSNAREITIHDDASVSMAGFWTRADSVNLRRSLSGRSR